MSEQFVVYHSSAGSKTCDGGQQHHWEDVSYEAHGIIRITHQKCQCCERLTYLRNDGGNFILRMGEEAD